MIKQSPFPAAKFCFVWLIGQIGFSEMDSYESYDSLQKASHCWGVGLLQARGCVSGHHRLSDLLAYRYRSRFNVTTMGVTVMYRYQPL